MVSQDAMTAIREITDIYFHKKVMRRWGDNPADTSHQAYVVEMLER